MSYLVGNLKDRFLSDKNHMMLDICFIYLIAYLRGTKAKLKAIYHMSRVVRKPAFCICENKDADQLRGNRKADQRLCFRYIDSTIPLLPKCKTSSL